MQSGNAIEVRNVSKTYVVKHTNFTGGAAKSRNHLVLNAVSFDVKKGEVLGIIGPNGSGKSTLLKILTGIMVPDSGTIVKDGEVASILELSSGFDPNFTGRENIRSKCSLYGFSNKEIDTFIDDIIAFSGLGEEIDDPLRTYSSGMSAKLALPTILYLRRDIMVFDEVLSIGDAGLGAKCNQIFRNIKKEGKTVIIASHNMRSIEKMCDRVLWLDEGVVKDIGKPSEICAKYEMSLIDSIDVVTRGAQSGDTVLQNRLGEMYRDGINTVADVERAEYWFNKASNLGFVPAMINLAAIMVEKGDVIAAKQLYKDAYDAGDVDAYRSLKSFENDEKGSEMLILFQKLAENGNVRAMYHYADCLYRGICTVKNVSAAFEWFKRSADGGEVLANLQLGRMYRDGRGTQKDPVQSEKYFAYAAINGNGAAGLELANMFRMGNGVERDIEKALHWYEFAANSGDVSAMTQLGTIFRDGLGVEKNPVKANMWFDMLAGQLKLQKENALGDILRKENRTMESAKEGIAWITHAANGGLIPAMLDLALTYRDGRGISASSEIAYKYYLECANHHHHGAEFELAQLLVRGNGTPKNDNLALEYYERAARSGNVAAMLNYAKLELEIFGTLSEKASTFLKTAADRGDLNAQVLMKQLL